MGSSASHSQDSIPNAKPPCGFSDIWLVGSPTRPLCVSPWIIRSPHASAKTIIDTVCAERPLFFPNTWCESHAIDCFAHTRWLRMLPYHPLELTHHRRAIRSFLFCVLWHVPARYVRPVIGESHRPRSIARPIRHQRNAFQQLEEGGEFQIGVRKGRVLDLRAEGYFVFWEELTEPTTGEHHEGSAAIFEYDAVVTENNYGNLQILKRLLAQSRDPNAVRRSERVASAGSRIY